MRTRNVIVAVLIAVLAFLVYSNLYRIKIASKAFYTIWTMPPDMVDEFMGSYKMYEKETIGEGEGHYIAAWYAVLNQFCTLGEVERMYIPPLLEPAASLSRNQDLMEERMARDLAVPSGGKVLELGCGRGRIAAHTATVFKSDVHVTGINVDKTQVAEAREHAQYLNLSHRLHFQVHDYNTRFPFDDNTFDGVYEVGAIMYVKDGDFLPLFKEMYRVLKPGGRIAINDWVTLPNYDPQNPIHKEITRKVREVSGWVYLAKKDEMSKAAEAAGFKVTYDNTFTDHGHTYQFLERVDVYFQAAKKLIGVLSSVGLLPAHFHPIFERATRGGEAVVEGDKMGLFTVEWYLAAEKPQKS
jgi:sterol 24-C-methyltransferase